MKDLYLSPENQLLLCCARTEMDEKMVDRISRIIEHPLDWDYTLGAALRHGVAPLLYYHLKMTNQCAPKEILSQLQRSYHITLVRNIRLFHELKRILDAFNTAGINVMPLKGPALAEVVYKNPALRPMGDLDLLVKERDFLKIKDTLVNNGYTSSTASLKLSGMEAVKYAHYFKQIRFFQNGLRIETHFRLINMGIPKSDEVEVWQRSSPLNIAGSETLMPSCEDFLLHLCVHAAQHNFSRLLIFCDIAEWIREYNNILNWHLLINLAEEIKARTIIFYSLFFARELLGASIPPDVMEELKPEPIKRKLFEIIWNKKEILKLKKKKRATAFEGPFCYLFGMGRIRDKILYLWMILCNSIKWSSSDCHSEPGSRMVRLRYLMRRIFTTGLRSSGDAY